MKNKDRPAHRCQFLLQKERVYKNEDGTGDFHQGPNNIVYNITHCPKCGVWIDDN